MLTMAFKKWLFKLSFLLSLAFSINGYSQNFKGGSDDGHAMESIGNINLNLVPEFFYPTITLAEGQSTVTNAPTINFKVTFNKSTNDFVSTDVTIGGSANPSTAVVTGGPTVFYVEVSGMSNGGTVTLSIFASVCTESQYGSSNAASLNVQNQVEYEIEKPIATIDLAPGQNDPAYFSPIYFSVNFSEIVTGFESEDVILSGTALATTAIVSGSGSSYQVSVSGMSAEGTVTLTIPEGICTDLAGNTNSITQIIHNTVTFMVNGPEVIVNKSALQNDPVNTLPVYFDVEFSREVVNFDFSDISWSGTANSIEGTVSGDGMNFLVTVNSVGTDGSLIASIPLGKVVDLFGLGNKASTSSYNSVTLDRVNPEVQIIMDPGMQNPTNSEIITFNASFSEAVPDFNSSHVSLMGSALPSTVYLRGGPQYYHIDVSGMSDTGWVSVNIQANSVTDPAGNFNNASDNISNTIFFDNLKPDVEVTTNILNPTDLEEIPVNITFSEKVNYFGISNISISNGTIISFTEATPDIAWNAVVQPLNTGVIDIQVPANSVVDAAGNGNNPSNLLQINYSGPIEIPFEANNIFTPNSAYNRYWIIKDVDNYSDYELIVRNSAGQVVYKTNNYQNNWNGTYNNKPLPTGTYYYLFKSASGDKLYKGFINIIFE
jgi:large repetitive protein